MKGYLIFAISFLSLLLVFFIVLLILHLRSRLSPEKKAGNRGERIAREQLRGILRKNDRLFSNIELSFDGKKAELDNVIVNESGVYIIEVKTLSGKLVGGEDDAEWKKYHVSAAGITYEKTVKNPVKQVRRQVYILSRYLSGKGVKIWVTGFVYLLKNNGDVKSDFIKRSPGELDRAVHPRRSRRGDRKDADAAIYFLKELPHSTRR